MKTTFSIVTIITLSLTVALSQTPVVASTIIASAHGDFVPGTNDGDIGPWPATGAGTWDYFGADTENPTLDPSHDSLEWSISANTYRFELYAEPAVGKGATELLVHPGQNAPKWGVIRWTAGAGEGGLVNVSGVFRKVDLSGGGVSGAMFLDGTLISGSAVTLAGNDGVGIPFDFDLTVSDGSIFDFVIGTNGDSSNDGSGVNITITSVPEPSTLLLGTLSIMSLGFLGRRRQTATGVNR